MNNKNNNPPSPQTGEKDAMQTSQYLIGYDDGARDYKEVLEDHRRLVRELDVILNGEGAAKQASLCDIVAQLRKQPPPPAQSDQDAAEKWQTDEQAARAYADEQCGTHLENPEVRVIHNGCYTDFLRGCTHVRGQQPQQQAGREAVEFAEWVDNSYEREVKKGWANLWVCRKTGKEYTTKELYTLFTSPPPTPKTDSQC